MATTYPARNPVTMGVACSKRSIVRPTSPSIAGSNVTTTYASRAAMKSPAPASASRTRFDTRAEVSGRGRGDGGRGVEAGHVDLDGGRLAAIAKRPVEDRLADEVVARVDPDP